MPSWDDDHWHEKVELLTQDPVPIVSFTFGCPPPEVMSRLHRAGSRVVVTVTTPAEAAAATEAGADAVCAQGIEAGGHQGTFDDDTASDSGWGLVALVRAIRHEVQVPVIAAGGLMTGAGVAAVIDVGAVAAQLGTALLLCPESGASEVHKSALEDPAFGATCHHACLQRSAGTRARQPVHGGTSRRAVGLSPHQQRHPGPAESGRGPTRPPRHQPVGGPGLRAGAGSGRQRRSSQHIGTACEQRRR